MNENPNKSRLWFKTLLWGAFSALLYVGLFANSDRLQTFAHKTPSSCIVEKDGNTLYFHKSDAQSCAEQGGRFESAKPWYVLVPIGIAFLFSFVHGAFTGLFWESVGMKPASRPNRKE